MHSYRGDLYGPERQAKYNSIRDLNLKDNVLQTGDNNLHGNSWDTHYTSVVKDLFSKNERLKEEPCNRKFGSHANESDHVFGQEGSCKYDLTSRDYGRLNQNFSPSKSNIDREIHIADFSPKYYDTGSLALSSMYKYSYNNNPKAHSFRANHAETQARTQDIRSTHFNLGSCKEKISTATSDSFKDALFVGDSSAKLQASKRQESNIFQSGDWNVLERSLVGHSVTAADFGKAEKCQEIGKHDFKRTFGISAKKSFTDMPDYVKTHIKYNGENDARTSFHRKDILAGRDGLIKKPYIAHAPPSSMVFPRDGSPVKSSMNNSDFLSYNEKLQDLNRSIDLTRNKIQLAENHVKPSESLRNSWPGTTITRNSYMKPKAEALTLKHEREPVSNYQHLDTDAALLKPRCSPLMSEAKAQHTARVISRTLNAGAERQLYNKATHFALGADSHRCTTEHTSQFSQPLGLDPKIPAAGVQVNGRCEIGITDNKNDDRSNEDMTESRAMKMQTITQEDYKPLETRGFTISQQRLISKLEKHPPSMASSHLFHLDNSKGPLKSRTKTDFIAPDRFTDYNKVR